MAILYFTAQLFGFLFFIASFVMFYQWYRLFPVTKKADPELYEKIRFKKYGLKSGDYQNFIFKQQYKDLNFPEVKYHANLLYWISHIVSWCFIIHLILMTIVFIFN